MSVALQKRQQGFTIVELMIAVAVLSVLLVVVSVAMMNIGNLYYKGLNQAKVQNSVRSISDELSSHLQLMSGNSGVGPFPGGSINVEGRPYDVAVYCIGDIRYTYVLGIQQGNEPSAANPQLPHVLWRDKQAGTCTASIPDLRQSTPSPGGAELIPSHARLTELTIAGTGTYQIQVGVAYGDKDLFVDEVVVGPDVRCKGDANTRFCASAYLNTGVSRRLSN